MSKISRPLLLTLSVANFVVGVGAFVVIAAIEPIASDLSISEAAAGSLQTTYAIAYAILSPLLVALTGRLGRRRVLAGGMAVFAIASALACIAPNLVLLHIARALAAAGAAVVTPVVAAVVANLSEPERQARNIAAVFAGLTIAQAIGVPLGSALAYGLGWEWSFALVAVIGLPAAWLIWTIVPAGLQFAPVTLADLGTIVTDARRMSAVLYTATFLGAIFTLYTYLAPLLSQVMGFSGALIPLGLFCFGVGAILGNMLGGALSDRFGANRVLLVLTATQIPLFACFSLLPIPAVLVFVLILVWATVGWCFGASQQVRIIGLDPARAPVLLAVNASCIYLGTAIGSAIGGVALSMGGPLSLGLTSAGLTGVAFLHLLLSNRATRRLTAAA